jgi:hypothetical protein
MRRCSSRKRAAARSIVGYEEPTTEHWIGQFDPAVEVVGIHVGLGRTSATR